MIAVSACSAELAMPRRADLEPVRRAAAHMTGVVSLVGLTDNHTGRARLSPLAAVSACRERGLAAVVHLSCRDRNRLGLQQQVMGAAALGASGVLVVRGDRGPDRARPALSVAEVLTEVPAWAGSGTLLRGAVFNPFADPDRELGLLQRKLAAGLDFLQTQMVFDLPAFDRFMAAAAPLIPPEVAVFASVGVIRSARSLKFVRATLPSCPIPQLLAQRLADGKGSEVAEELAAEIGSRRGLRLHVIPLGAERHAAGICEAFRSSRDRLMAAAG